MNAAPSHPLGEGVGMASGLETLTLDYARGDGPKTMVLKYPTKTR